MNVDALIKQIRQLRAYLAPDRDVAERVRHRVMDAIQVKERKSWPLFTSFFRLTAGALAIMTLMMTGLVGYFYQSPEGIAYIGDLQVLKGTVQITSAPEDGKPPIVQTVEPRADRKAVRVKVKAGDVIKTSSGSTVSLSFDNSSTAVVKDATVLKVEGVTTKDNENKPKSVAVTLEQGTIETGGATETTVKGSVLEVNTLTKSVQTSDAAVSVQVQDGATTIASLEKNKKVETIDLGTKVIVAAVEEKSGNTNVNGPAPSGSPKPTTSPLSTGSPAPTPSTSPSTSPIPSPSPSTGSGETIKKTSSEGDQVRT